MGFDIQKIIAQTQPLSFGSLNSGASNDVMRAAPRSPSELPQSRSSQGFEIIPSIAETRASSTLSSLVQVAKELGEPLLKQISRLYDSFQGSKAKNIEEQAAARAELEGLVTQYAPNEAEAGKYRNAIDELFAAFKDNKTVQAAQEAGSKVLKALEDIGITKETAKDAFKVIQNWKNLSDTDRFASAGKIGIQVVENLGVISKEQSQDFQGVAAALSVLTNKQASKSQKALAAAQALAGLATKSVSGTSQMPTSYGGVPVVGSAALPDGSHGYLLADGNVVARTDVIDSFNVASALQAISVLASDAKSRDKALALAKVGIDAGVANGMISEVNAGRFGAALSVFNTASNWSDMDTGQRIASTLQTANSVMGALGNSAGSGIGAVGRFAASMGGKILSGAASVAGLVMGVTQAIDTFKALGDMPKGSERVAAGAIGLGTAGMAIGASIGVISSVAGAAYTGAMIGSSVPIVGTIVGGLVGAAVGALAGVFGSGKGKGQKARDSWRDVMEKAGFATKINGSHHVTLADGSKYNIGADGKGKVRNADGTERRTYEIDWNNPLSGQHIPAAQVFALATGLDPTSHQDAGLWDSAVGQTLSAAMSNTQESAGIKANIKAMIESSGITPDVVALKIEVLRLTNKISDQEYQVFLHEVNEIFGTELKPAERGAAHQGLVQYLASQPQLSEGDQKTLVLLTNPEEYQKSLNELQERLAPKDKK